MKVALVHEFLNQLGGAEKVLESLLEMWPEARIHLILYDKERTNRQFEGFKKNISWLNSFPGVKNHPRLFLIFMPLAIESFDFSDYDLVFSDSSSFAHAAKTGKVLHICYCHTPARFLWTDPHYIDDQKYAKFLRMLGKFYLKALRRWDLETSSRPSFYIANSVNVQNRIKEFYNRESVVIPPPVDTEFFRPVSEKKDFFLTVTRLEPYKHVDLIIQAFNQTGSPLKIAGIGTQLEKLRSLANKNIEFVGRVPDEELRKLYSEAKAFVYAAVEDAGIALLEAQACGTPVIAYKAGGALEVVEEGITGELFDDQTTASLIRKLESFTPSKYDPEVLRANALKYSKKSFQQKISKFVEDKYREYNLPELKGSEFIEPKVKDF